MSCRSEQRKVLVTGEGGMLGRAVSRALEQRCITHDARTRSEFDMMRDDCDQLLREGRYLTVINTAAWTAVDGAEEHETEAHRINGAAVGSLARACADTQALLVHFSTDHVFDGQHHAPYAVDHVRRPVNAYGRSKLAGERALESSGCDYLLVRTSWLYAPWGSNFVRTVLQQMRERETLRIVDDQRGRPTSAEQLAVHTLDLIDRAARGTYHVAGGGSCTWYELACEIAHHCGADCHIKPCATMDMPRRAPRPANGVLNVSRTEREIGLMEPWREALHSVLTQIDLDRSSRLSQAIFPGCPQGNQS